MIALNDGAILGLETEAEVAVTDHEYIVPKEPGEGGQGKRQKVEIAIKSESSIFETIEATDKVLLKIARIALTGEVAEGPEHQLGRACIDVDKQVFLYIHFSFIVFRPRVRLLMPRSHVRVGLDLEVQRDERENKAAEVLDEIVENSQTLRVFTLLHSKKRPKLPQSKGYMLPVEIDFQLLLPILYGQTKRGGGWCGNGQVGWGGGSVAQKKR